jgi:tetratricopeptide (TPR) repeat protein
VWLGLLAAVGAAAYCLSRRHPTSNDRSADKVSDEEQGEPVVMNPGYVGSGACAACHADRVAECRTTNHYRTFRTPDPAAMPVGFEPGKGSYASQIPGLRYEMSRSGEDFFQTAIHSTPAGQERSTARIDLVLGAGGKADEVYLTWREGRLYELPVAWLFSLDCWGSSHVSRYNTGGFLRESTVRCLECHNTWFAHVPGTLNEYDRSSFLPGVTCENCHGPGREHVAFHKAHPRAESGQQIVRPARLPRERQIEVCTQCHGNAVKHRGPALQYRPGEPLESCYKTLLAPKHPEDDHVANQIKYLRQSKCFQNSGEMTCTTCHNPHRPEPVSVSGNEACLKCHSSGDCGEQERLPVAVRSDCAGCHMPLYIKINVNFETVDDNFVPPIRRCDHRIAVHPRAQQEVLLNWHRRQRDTASREEAARLTQSLADQWLAEGETCRRDFRLLGAIAAFREAYRIDPVPSTRVKIRDAVAVLNEVESAFDDAVEQLREQNYTAAIATLERLLHIKPDLAKAHGRLGTAFAATGNEEQATEHLRDVEKFDPDSPYGEAMLGWLAYLKGDSEQAVRSLERANAIEPYNSQINYHWGLALLKLERWDEASAKFQRVITIDPRHAAGWQGLSVAMRHCGRLEEALGAARRAARLTHSENADILLSLVDACADSGRHAEAAQAAEKALEAAQTRSPDLVPQIRRRLRDLESGWTSIRR